ncbi:MAG: exosome complex RNA-binding protein Rrp4 [Candidatus Bathyarchaeia archaeon]
MKVSAMVTYVQNRELVIPGDLLTDDDYTAGANTYSRDRRIYASRIGLAELSENRVSVVPLKGCYIPHLDDQIIGRITDIGLSGWEVDISAPYPAMLPASEAIRRTRSDTKPELSRILDVGDLIVGKVIAFDRTRDPLLSIKGPGFGRVTSGRVIEISPTKIPRLIGRKGSMVEMIKKETGSQIMIGQNGIVLVSNRNPALERLTIMAIYKIEREAHTERLTDRVKEMIRRKIENGNISTEPRS